MGVAVVHACACGYLGRVIGRLECARHDIRVDGVLSVLSCLVGLGCSTGCASVVGCSRWVVVIVVSGGGRSVRLVPPM